MLKATKPEDSILLLKISGDAYTFGDISATKDAQKAIEKYKEFLNFLVLKFILLDTIVFCMFLIDNDQLLSLAFHPFIHTIFGRSFLYFLVTKRIFLS